MNQQLLDRFAAAFGIPATEAAVLQLANSHPHHCACDACLFWWASVGADENGKYGPFAPQEVAYAQMENNQP